MALAKSRTRINIGGGYLEVSIDGGANWDFIGYTESSKINDGTAIEEFHDEMGEFLGLGEGNELVTFECVMLQSTLDELNFWLTYKGKKIDARYQAWMPGTSKWQLYSLDEVIVDPNLDLPFGTSKRTWTFKVYSLKGATTGKYYAIAETANDPPQAGDWPDAS